MDARNWPPLVRALPLPEVAELLGIPHRHLLEKVADGVIAVCTRKPLQEGSWSVFNAYIRDPERAIHDRRPFNGRTLARLLEFDAAECVSAGQVVVVNVMEEPRSAEVYEDAEYVQYFGPGAGTLIATDDLLVSRVEFEHFIHYYRLNYPQQPEQEPAGREAAGFAELAPAEKPLTDSERRSAGQIIAVLAAEARIDLSAPYAADATLRAVAARHGLVLPNSPETVVKYLKYATVLSGKD